MKTTFMKISNLYLILVLMLSFCFCSSNDASKEIQVPVHATEIPLGGNAYITSPAGNGTVEDSGIINWSDPGMTFSVYFRVNLPGEVNLFLKYSADTDGSIIQATCEDSTFRVTLDQTGTPEQTVYLGTVKCNAGYVQVDFKGVERKGSIYCKPSALVVDGMATAQMNFVGNFSYYWGRRGPSVHMNYAIPEGVTAEWFYNEVTVPEGQDPVGSYFMSNGFGEGYFGMQVNSETERRVLFSVWSPFETDDPEQIPDEHKIILVKKGDDVQTGEFGNEGSGGQSFLRYNWQAGTTYCFLTHIRPSENGYSEYTSYFFAPEVGSWKLIAQFLRPGTTTYYTRPHSFLENFINRNGYLGRKAYYNNQWVYTKEGEWIELTQGTFTADATARAAARMDYKGGAEPSGFFLQNCGFFDDYTQIQTVFNRPAIKNRPNIIWSELKSLLDALL